MLSAVLANHVADGRGYPRARAVLNDTADPVAVIRNGLSAQIDQNGAVVLAGPPVNLLGVIARPDGRDWVTRKARVLSIAAGRFAAGPVDPMIRRDRDRISPAARGMAIAHHHGGHGIERGAAVSRPQPRIGNCLGDAPPDRGCIPRVQDDAVRRAVAIARRGASGRQPGPAVLRHLAARHDHDRRRRTHDVRTLTERDGTVI